MLETTENKKIAIVVFNLGGPDSLKSVKPFLFNLFNDKNIITLPFFIRFFIAKIISWRRNKAAQEIYARTGNKSPILEATIAQRDLLKEELKDKINSNFEIFICMRHWHPMTDEVVKKIEKYNPDEIVLLPLYPQYSTTTTGSSIEEFIKKLKNKNKIKIKTICCYPTEDGFISSYANLIEKYVPNEKDLKDYRILFSAHGLPERIIQSGDPYQWQIEQTVQKIIEKLSEKPQFKNIDYKITYQSRVGPLKWLKPDTAKEIKLAGIQKKSLIIVPVAFVSEHVETLVELDIEYKKIAMQYDIDYIRIPTVSTDNLFIKSLAKMVLNFIQKDQNFLSSSKFSRLCPDIYTKCPCKIS